MVRLSSILRGPLMVAAAALAACGGGGHSSSVDPWAVPLANEGHLKRPASSSGLIQHVVIIVQENRSFDNLFQGYPGANTVPAGENSQHQRIKLQPVSLATKYVIDHSFVAFRSACHGTGSEPGIDCRMDGFDKESSYSGPANPEYVYVPHSESKPYFGMAHEFVLADNMFQSHVDESFVSHQYLIAAQAASSVDLPATTWGCDGGKKDRIWTISQDRKYQSKQQACFDYQTIGDELNAAGLTWRFYTSVIGGDGGDWSGYQAVRHIRYGPDWANVITPQTQFFTDLSNGSSRTSRGSRRRAPTPIT